MRWWNPVGLIVASVAGLATRSPASPAGSEFESIRRDAVHGHGEWCHHVYVECARRAVVLDEAVRRFTARPSQALLDEARSAWVSARAIYCLSEALRYCDGPIEAVEPALNAWPLDEAYIDSVAGRLDAGIINDPRTFPQIGSAVLQLANERGGETNISIGWHAVEFLLWGQDLRADGPGDRPFTDYVAEKGRNAQRRGEYLRAVTGLLAPTLDELGRAWAPDAANYRRTFEEAPDVALRKMLTGAIVLTSFELSGERLGVAYETRDQEQEHSCFSDTTHLDLQADQAGIVAIFTGEHDGRTFGPGLLACLRAKDPAIADDVRARLARTTAAIRAIPAPFDRAILGPDDAPGRVAIQGAIDALQAQTDAIAIAGHAFGFHLPLEPGG